MTIVFRTDVTPEAADVANLYRRAELIRPVDDLDRIASMLENADVIVSAWDGERLVGVARTITDYRYCAYLSDLAVDPDYQRQGIGKELVQRLRDFLGDEVMILLLSVPNAMEYYPHIGFEQAGNAFLIRRLH
jgi:GNAT superfamily N-acetyltransferase